MDARCRIEMLGGLRVQQGERVITRFRTQKSAGLLAYLAYHLDQVHPREAVVELLWPGRSPRSGRNSLNTALSSLRRQLEPPGVPRGSVIQTDRFTLRLNPDAITTDVADLEAALDSATEAESATERSQCLSDAIELYQGELLPGYYEDWILVEQRRLADLYFEAVRDLTTLLRQTGDLDRAVDIARVAVTRDPLREEVHCQLMRLYTAAGQPAAALRQYAELEQILERELGEEPSNDAHRLARRLEAEARDTEQTPAPTQAVAREAPTQPSPRPSALPTGTVTFLMTDIQGSTALWEREGDVFKTALESHHALLRREFRRHGGEEAKEMGDSFIVAFASAGDAVACAIACQEALAGHEWPEAVRALPVRMAVHIGDVTPEDGEYRGPVLHHAARMVSAAHGWQILCSEATAALVRRHLPPGVRLVDLGVYRLRDVATPERLFQIEYPEMSQRRFPALNAEAAYADNLPLQLTRFIGREDELVRLEQSLASEEMRLLTLTGSGGTGKTRLALEAAGRLLETYDGAVWFVSLGDLSDAELIPRAIADALGLPRSVDAEPMEQVVEALSRQRSLLILDNLEQLGAGPASVVHTLLDRARTVTCVATSRQRLSLPGEREFSVPPLQTPQGTDTPEQLSRCESVQLFVDRAQAVIPDFQVTPANAEAIATLCNRLDGIPLALELAAARAQVLTPSQMVEQLEDRFDFLVSRQKMMEERHRTMQAAIEWSYRLLSPELQHFFALLSVFRGGCTLEAAQAICDAPLTLDCLEQLRESSLVVAEETSGDMRYRLLETLAEYGRDQVDPDEWSALRRKHAEYYLGVAEEATPQLRGVEQATWLQRLALDQENLRAALEWSGQEQDGELCVRLAVAASPVLYHRGLWMEARRWLETGLTAAESLTGDKQALTARMHAELAGIALDTGEFAEARKLAEQSLVARRDLDDQPGAAEALNLLGLVALHEGDTDAAQSCFEEVLRLRTDDHGRALAQHNLARLASLRGDEGEAGRLYEKALIHRRAAGDARGEAETLGNMGALAQNAGEFAEARCRYHESLSLYRALRYPYGIATMLNNLAEISEADGDQETAVVLFVHAERILRDLRSRHASVPGEALERLAGWYEADEWEQLRTMAASTEWERIVDSDNAMRP